MMLPALLISLLAGLATTLGGLLATHRRASERPFLAMSLAFAAGAMLFVSFVEIIPLGIKQLEVDQGLKTASLIVYGAFFIGILVVLGIDRILPKSINPNEIEGREDDLSHADRRSNKRLIRSGLLVGLVLALHNFPEGMSTFVASYQNLHVGLTLALAIAVHNIPEGIAVAAPVYAATKSRKQAVWWATLSGLTEPLGAIVAALLIAWIIPPALFGVLFGLVAGMMVFIAVDELLPAAHRYQTDKHQTIYGLLAGMGVVAISLILLV